MGSNLNLFGVISILFLFSCNQIKKEIITQESKSYSNQNLEALKYCNQNNFNTDYYFLLDYSIHSGKKRFFIYDFKKNQIINSELVAHGSCDVFESNPNKETIVKFSNEKDSHCSSKGKYKISERAYSNWGIHTKYWLKGLEKTNSNAIDRVVVLHSWKGVPDKETYPTPIVLSWGCPTVSNQFMKKIDQKIKSSNNKSILLWIID